MLSKPRTLLLVLLALLGCGKPSRPPLLSAPIRSDAPIEHLLRPSAAQPRDRRALVVGSARRYLEGQALVAGDLQFENDPVGFVRAAFWSAEIDLFAPEAYAQGGGGMAILYRSALAAQRTHSEQPRRGDLAYFDASTAANQALPAAVAIVEQIDSNGTITLLGFFAAGARRVHMNLRHPEVVQASGGKPMNDVLGSGSGATATTAQLFRIFADPF